MLGVYVVKKGSGIGAKQHTYIKKHTLGLGAQKRVLPAYIYLDMLALYVY